jgi:prepilin-type processing-associated H-X9-DG protein
MGEAWTIYLTENNGFLPASTWNKMPPGLANTTQAGQDYAWQNGNIFAILATLKTNTQFLLCPEATEPQQYDDNEGFGSATNAWTGYWQSKTPLGTQQPTPIATFMSSDVALFRGKFVDTTIYSKPGGYRIGSYGAIGWIYWNFNQGNVEQWGTKVSEIKNTTNVPIIFDCVWPDLTTVNNSHTPPQPPDPPPNLSGANIPGSGGDMINWRILINRHNRGINVLFADGSARWVALPDLGMLQWGRTWMTHACEWNNLPRN